MSARYRVATVGGLHCVLDMTTPRLTSGGVEFEIVGGAGYVNHHEAHGVAKRLNHSVREAARHARETAAFNAAWHASRFDRAREAM